jgi:hypothetical protein
MVEDASRPGDNRFREELFIRCDFDKQFSAPAGLTPTGFEGLSQTGGKRPE